MYKIIRFKNGLTFLLIKKTGIKSVYFTVDIKAGSNYETSYQNGIAHFVEHMLLKGTKNFPTYDVLWQYQEDLGGNIDVYSTSEYVFLDATFPKENFKKASKLIGEIIFEAKLDIKAIKAEKKVIFHEIEEIEDLSHERLAHLSQEIRFKEKNSVYGQPIGGTKKTITKIKEEEVKDFYNKFYIPQNITIGIMADLKYQYMANIISNFFDKYKRKKFSSILPNPEYSDQIIKFETKPFLDRIYFNISFPSYSYQNTTKERITLNMIRSILSGLRSSILVVYLRGKKKLVYDVSSNVYIEDLLGVFIISSSCKVGEATQVLKYIIETLKNIKKRPISKKLFLRVKNYFNYSNEAVFDQPAHQIDWIIHDVRRKEKVVLPGDVIKITKSINLLDIKKTANEIFDLSKINIIMIGPKTSKGIVNRLKGLI